MGVIVRWEFTPWPRVLICVKYESTDRVDRGSYGNLHDKPLFLSSLNKEIKCFSRIPGISRPICQLALACLIRIQMSCSILISSLRIPKRDLQG